MWTLEQAIERRRLERKIAELEEYMEETQTDDQSFFDELKELRRSLSQVLNG